MQTTVLKPGLLVALHTSTRGGVNYKRIDVEPEHRTDEGELRAAWQTERTIPDPEEFERAGAARGKARSVVSAVCCTSSFGLLCPSLDEEKLRAAIAEARKIADEHNAGARLTRVEVFVLVGRIAQDDAEAARAIAAEVRGLLDAMQAGIAAADPEAIREAASKARALGGMLTDDVGAKVTAAIKEARSAAREIVKRVEKSGEQAASVIKYCSVKAIESARFSFLDMDAEGKVEATAPAGRGLDLPPTDAAPVQAVAAPQLSLEV